MKTIEQMITERFEEKINNGDFEKIIDEKLDTLIRLSLDNLTSWGAPLKKQLEERLKPVLETAVANSDLDNILDKMTLLLNNVLANSELKKSLKLQNNLEEYLTYSKGKYDENLKLSEIFNKYVEFAQNECEILNFEEDDLDFEEGTAHIYFTASLEEVEEDEKKRGYFSRYSDRKFILKTRPNDYDESDNHEMPELDIEFKIDSLGYLSLCEDISINRLANYPAFIWFLIRLSQTSYKIEIDRTSFEEEFEVPIDED